MDQRTSRPVTGDDPEQIRQQILRTRRDMANTINQIQGRLSPDVLRQQAEDSLREATVGKVEDMAQQAEYKMKGWRKDAMQTVRENPIPLALIGIGAAWMFFSGKDDDDEYDYYADDRNYQRGRYNTTGRGYGYGRNWNVEDDDRMMAETRDRAATMADDATDWASDVASDARQTVNKATNTVERKVNQATDTVERKFDQATDAISDQASSFADSARETSSEWRESATHAADDVQARARRAKRTFGDMIDENPLAVGFAALAAGALLGLLIPGTERENELMGEQRDQLMEEVSHTAKDAAERVQSVVEESRTAAVDAGRKEARAQSEDIPVIADAINGVTSKNKQSTGSDQKSADSAQKSTDSAAQKTADSAQKTADSAQKSTDSAQKTADSAQKSTDSAQKSPAEQAGERTQRASS